MSKHWLVTLVLSVILLTVALTLVLNARFFPSVSKNEADAAINQARLLYKIKKQNGEDLSSVYCLSDALMPNWVVMIVHQPKQITDDLKTTLCPSYMEGRSKHFVELDSKGNLLRVK